MCTFYFSLFIDCSFPALSAAILINWLIDCLIEVQDPSKQSEYQKYYEGKDLWNRWDLSLELKAEGVIDGKSDGGDVLRWYAQDEVNQEESEQNKVDGTMKGADSTGEVMHI